ncbi:hypothetical protein ACLOJK_038785, partial [Asimina triloba]
PGSSDPGRPPAPCRPPAMTSAPICPDADARARDSVRQPDACELLPPPDAAATTRRCLLQPDACDASCNSHWRSSARDRHRS